jgi:hypothetical protein
VRRPRVLSTASTVTQEKTLELSKNFEPDLAAKTRAQVLVGHRSAPVRVARPLLSRERPFRATQAPRDFPLTCARRTIGWLASPSGELSFVELAVLVDVEVAHFLVLGCAGRDRTQRRAAEAQLTPCRPGERQSAASRWCVRHDRASTSRPSSASASRSGPSTAPSLWSSAAIRAGSAEGAGASAAAGRAGSCWRMRTSATAG